MLGFDFGDTITYTIIISNQKLIVYASSSPNISWFQRAEHPNICNGKYQFKGREKVALLNESHTPNTSQNKRCSLGFICIHFYVFLKTSTFNPLLTPFACE